MQAWGGSLDGAPDVFLADFLIVDWLGDQFDAE
jgi:hypothetical protein